MKHVQQLTISKYLDKDGKKYLKNVHTDEVYTLLQDYCK